jgi:hypothetical protein
LHQRAVSTTFIRGLHVEEKFWRTRVRRNQSYIVAI